MKIIGLTGSIGMGKSTAAALFRLCRIPVYDADEDVHRLSRPGGPAVTAIAKAFPSAVTAGVIDRQALGALVFEDPAALARLEAILHPRLKAAQHRFLRRARSSRHRLVVLDIPLLFETGGDREVDYVLVVSCPGFLQDARVLARPGMTPSKLRAIRATQMPDPQKRRRADLVLPTGLGKRRVLAQIIRLSQKLTAREK